MADFFSKEKGAVCPTLYLISSSSGEPEMPVIDIPVEIWEGVKKSINEYNAHFNGTSDDV